MVPAMAMITSSVAPQRRGGFLGANSAVQHVAAGLGAFVGGLILTKVSDGTIENYPLVGFLGVAATLVGLWLAGRLRIVGVDHETGMAESLTAATQGSLDADEPITAAEISIQVEPKGPLARKKGNGADGTTTRFGPKCGNGDCVFHSRKKILA